MLVEVIEDPAYTLKAYMSIYDEDQKMYLFDKEKSGTDIEELNGIGTYVLSDVYKKLYEDEILTRYFEDKQKEREMELSRVNRCE